MLLCRAVSQVVTKYEQFTRAVVIEATKTNACSIESVSAGENLEKSTRASVDLHNMLIGVFSEVIFPFRFSMIQIRFEAQRKISRR